MWNNQGFSQSGYQGGGFNTPQADEKKRASKRSNNIVPVTVAQILTAKHVDDVFMSSTNIELSLVTIVGLVKSVSVSPTRTDYLIDDMTGPPLEVRKFDNSDENEQSENAEPNAFPPNTYVRIDGVLRAFGGKRTINAQRISPLTDMNELTCHILEVIYANATFSQEQTNTGVSSNAGAATSSSRDDTAQGTIPGLTSLQGKIQMIIRNEQSERGCSFNDICNQLKNVAPKAIRETIEFLSGEGHIYSTIDDDHFQATDT
ncbi:unnamed protein product [Lymnaea stagnalis]|uniref:Replication protein A C-terminal domain-containing protein n=1 Tax=Lymnaea stagnalis TaxID=6523 RepID=A0AAV2HT06_LYMST